MFLCSFNIKLNVCWQLNCEISVGNMLVKGRMYVGNVLGTSRMWVGNMLGTCWMCVGKCVGEWLDVC